MQKITFGRLPLFTVSFTGFFFFFFFFFFEPGRVAQPVTCLTTDACLTADPEVASSIPVLSHTFVEIDHEYEKFLRSFSSLPLIHSKRVVVSY